MSTLLVTNLANICDTARFTAEKQFFHIQSKIQNFNL